MNEPAAVPDYTQDFESIREAEKEWIVERRAAAGLPPITDDLVGLAFSGGGIRSATFNLGVLQALEKSDVLRHVDVLSSVSGGGYAASCYHWLRANADMPQSGSMFDAQVKGGGTVLDWLRAHGKYLIAQRGFSIWTLLASILASTFVNLLVILPPLLMVVYALTLGWLPASWLAEMLPQERALQGHHGFLLLLLAGMLCLALIPFFAVAFALLAGVDRFHSAARVDRWRVAMGRLLCFGLALLALGSIPLAARLGEFAAHYFSMHSLRGIGMHMSYLAPVLGGRGSFVFDRRRGGKGRSKLASVGLALVVYGLLILCYHLAAHDAWMRSSLFAVLLVASLLLAVFCNLNRVSIHAYYRGRLGNAFLPVLGDNPAIHPDRFAMDALDPRHGAPLALINTTLNTTSSHNETLRSREGASFFLSPLFCGSSATGWRRSNRWQGGRMTLANAFTISGAAIDPDMVDTRARPVSFLMALLNVRLGFWANNPRWVGSASPFLPWWWIFIGREMSGFGLDENRGHVHLSDGGGFENLGIYELIRRRVRYLIVTDAGADPDTTLSDLGRAIERARVDFGARIRIDADRLFHQRNDALMQQPYAIGTIHYADGSTGEILYIKPKLCMDLSADIYAYWRAHPAFPDEPTSEQFFGETQFEAYRALGQQIMQRLLPDSPVADIGEWLRQIRS